MSNRVSLFLAVIVASLLAVGCSKSKGSKGSIGDPSKILGELVVLGETKKLESKEQADGESDAQPGNEADAETGRESGEEPGSQTDNEAPASIEVSAKDIYWSWQGVCDNKTWADLPNYKLGYQVTTREDRKWAPKAYSGGFDGSSEELTIIKIIDGKNFQAVSKMTASDHGLTSTQSYKLGENGSWSSNLVEVIDAWPGHYKDWVKGRVDDQFQSQSVSGGDDYDWWCYAVEGRDFESTYNFSTFKTKGGQLFQGVLEKSVEKYDRYECRLENSETEEVKKTEVLAKNIARTRTSFYSQDYHNPFGSPCAGQDWDLLNMEATVDSSGKILDFDKSEVTQIK